MSTTMNFGEALHHLTTGKAMRRVSWPNGARVTLEQPLEGGPSAPWYCFDGPEGRIAWAINDTDTLAEDWEFVLAGTGEVEIHYPAITLGRPVLVNTPGRPINGAKQFAGIVTAVHSESRASVYVFPAGGSPFHLPELEREDLLDRTNFPNVASWQFTS